MLVIRDFTQDALRFIKVRKDLMHYCENEKGEKFLVEMQRGEQQFFKDRSVYYATFPIREQSQRGKWDYGAQASRIPCAAASVTAGTARSVHKVPAAALASACFVLLV